MSRLPINIGTTGNDATGDSIREAFRKTNANFTELYTSLGLGDRQKFTNLDDVPNGPDAYNNQEGKILAVNAAESGLEFLTVLGTGGIEITVDSAPVGDPSTGTITIHNASSSIITDQLPKLGNDLDALYHKIYHLADPTDPTDAVNLQSGLLKSGYSADFRDNKMTGPLILNRDPIVSDDRNFNGLIAATKRYVDNSSFFSTVNFFVSTSGTDYRADLTDEKRGRAWAYAFRSVQRACEAAEAVINATPYELGPYQKILTFDGGLSEAYVVSYEAQGNGTSNLALYTNSQRTDYENDLRSGLYVQGDSSKALAKIVTVNSSLVGDNEIFVVTPIVGTFASGEKVRYTDAVQAIQITIFVESGIYEENFPIKIPPNVSIVGDEFRRAIIRPRNSVSASPWAGITFRRDKVFDGIRLTDYVGSNLAAETATDATPNDTRGTVTITLNGALPPTASQWIGGFFRAQQGTNKFAEGLITAISTSSFTVVLHDDFLSTSTVESGKWTVYQSQNYGKHYLSDITRPIYPVVNYGDHVNAARVLQLNKAFIQAEVTAFLDSTYSSSTSFTYDREKCARDVRLILDAVVADMVLGSNYQSVTAGAAYLRSYSSNVTTLQKAQTIAGITKAKLLTVDAVSGNSDAVTKITNSFNTVIRIITNGESSIPSTIDFPNPVGLANSKRYAKQLLVANKSFIKREVTAWLSAQQDVTAIPGYVEATCERDVGYILDALIYDLVYNGNSQTVGAALAYVSGSALGNGTGLGLPLEAGAESSIPGEESVTVSALGRMKTLVTFIAQDQTITKTTTGTSPNGQSQVRKAALSITDPLTDATAATDLGLKMDDLIGIINTIDVTSPYTTPPTIPTVVFPTFSTGTTELKAAKAVIDARQEAIGAGVVAYIDDRYSGTFTYNRDKCARDVGIVVDAMAFDLRYSGGSRTIAAALTYFQAGAAVVLADQLYETTTAYNYLNDLAVTLINDPLTTIEYFDAAPTLAGVRPVKKYQQSVPQVYPRVETAVVSFVETTRSIVSSDVNITNFVDSGFQAGDVITVAGTVNNNDTYTVVSVTESTIVVLETLTTEAASAGVTITNDLEANGGSADAVDSLSDAITGIINSAAEYNPPKKNDQLDVFLTNDAIQLRNLTIQGHGGFTMVFDPEGQIRTKSPYAQTCSSMARSINTQIFTGGQFVDGFAGNVQAVIVSGNETNPVEIPAKYKSINVSGLDRLPQTPCSFVISGVTYSVTTINDYDIVNGTAVVNLLVPIPVTAVPEVLAGDLIIGKIYAIKTLGDTDFTLVGAITNTVGTVFTATGVGSGTGSVYTAVELVTAGNRSMLSNDFTQVNDMGYGLVATNNGLIEAVSVFTYYCYTAYYSLNGGQIRALNGSCAYGINALKAEGSDPLEVPDEVAIKYDLVQTANVWAPITLTLNEAITGDIAIGDTITQANSGMTGTLIELNASRKTISILPVLPRTAGAVISIVGGTNTGTIHSSATGTVNFLTAGFTANHYITIYGTVSNDGAYKISGSPTSSDITLSQKFVNGAWTSTFTTTSEDEGTYLTVAVNGTFLSTAADTLDGPGWTNNPYPTVVGSDYAASTGGLTLYVDSAEYLPNNLSEIEITFAGAKNRVYRYEVASSSLVSTVIPTAVGAGEFVVGQSYTIVTLGSVSFATVGAASNTVGSTFVATGVGASGIGTATLNDAIRNNTSSVYKLNLAAGSASVGATGLYSPTYHGEFVTLRQNRTLWLQDLAAVSAVRPSTALVLDDQPTSVYRVLSFTLVNTQLGTYVWSGTVATITSTAHAIPDGSDILISFSGSVYGNPSTNKYTATVINSNTFTVNIGSANGTGYDSIGDVSFSVTTGEGYANLREPYGQIIVNDYSGTSVPYPSGAGSVGDTSIACVALSLNDIPRIVGMKFAWYDTKHTINGYLPPGEVGGTTDSGSLAYGILSFTPALTRPFRKDEGNYDSYNSFRAVQVAGVGGNISVNISTMRATGHDMLNIGTGSYADSNYPNNLYGPPNTAPASSKEVQEIGKGRVFYVSTDQDGNFKVGEFFKVDQGTGTVTFSASIALSNLNGLGFKRGVAISEFSTDDTMTDNAADTVPTEQALRGYIDKRLGITHNGGVTPSSTLIPSGGGFIDRKGLLGMNGQLKMNGNTVTDLGNPAPGSDDAVPYSWLTFGKLQDFEDNNIQAGDLLAMTGVGTNVTNVKVEGPVTFNMDTLGDSSTPRIHSVIGAGQITNTMFSSDSGDKLSLSKVETIANAGVGISAGVATKGLASFNSTQFSSSSGFISFIGTVALSSIGSIAGYTVLGNNSGSSTAPAPVAFTDVVSVGGGIKKSDFGTASTIMAVNAVSGGAATTFNSLAYGPENGASTIVQRDASGDFVARTITVGTTGAGGLKLSDGGSTSPVLAANIQTVLKSEKVGVTAGVGSHTIYAYDGDAAIQMQGGTGNKKTIYSNDSHDFRNRAGTAATVTLGAGGTLNVGNNGVLTTGSSSNVGQITGQWALTSGSRMEATYADLAEYYSSDKEYPTGWVMMFGGSAEVTAANINGTTKVAGVVSTDPAYTMNSALEGTRVCLALQGRVPCRVVGKIKKGDLIIASDMIGVAVSAGENARAGSIIGKALADYDSDHIGLIEVAVGRL